MATSLEVARLSGIDPKRPVATKMKNAYWKDFAELVGIAAIVASLLFVGIELRQNTAAVHAATMMELTAVSNDSIIQLAIDSELAAIVAKRDRSEELSEVETLQIRNWDLAYWIRMQNAFSHYRRGTIDQEDWSFYEYLICNSDREWESFKLRFQGPFIEFVTECQSLRQ